MAVHQVDLYTNYNLTDIVTPVRVNMLQRLLTQSRYDPEETQFLVNGFRHGFSIGYQGPVNRQDTAWNLPFSVGDKFILWNKVMKEVRLKWYAGPYRKIPYQYFIQSLVGLVPKHGGRTRLIFHLSYKFSSENESLNYWTPREDCSVKYNDLDHVILNSLKMVRMTLHQTGSEPDSLYYTKTDLMSAFCGLPCSPESWPWMVLKAHNPITNQTFFFVDKTLAFGASISCSHFQRFSNCLKHLIKFVLGRSWIVTNYLDDFIFLDTTVSGCNLLVEQFLDICKRINFPVSLEKTEWATSEITFLGMLFISSSRTISLLIDKIHKAEHMLNYLMNKKKATVAELERLAGFLNFLNKAIVPGRTFMHRMYTKFSGQKID